MDQSVTEVEPATLIADLAAHRVARREDIAGAAAAGEEAALEGGMPETAARVVATDIDHAAAAPTIAPEEFAPAQTALATETAPADASIPEPAAAGHPVPDVAAAAPPAAQSLAEGGAAAEPDPSGPAPAKPAAAKVAAAKPATRSRPEAANDAAPVAVAGAPSPPVPERAQAPMRHGDSRGSHMMNGRPPAISRASLLDETFSEGDHVVYPTHGVGRVEKIAVEEIAGQKLELIQITFEENRMTLRVPVTKARSAGLRRLATRKLFDEALALLKGRARIKKTMWSRRAQEYEAKINSGDPLQIAEVVRDLHRNSGQPDQSFSERQIYEAALDRLAAELAALDETDKATASTKLTNFLKTIA